MESKEKKQNCIIFGASVSGEKAYAALKDNYNIIGFSDNNSKKWNELFLERKVFSPAELAGEEEIEIIIASHHYAAIGTQLIEAGIKKIKVFIPDVKEGDNISYGLYEYNGSNTLFKSCTYNSENISRIKKDFKYNYEDLDNYVALGNLNEKRQIKKKVLFCAYIFPPLGGSGVQRSLKFVKYLRKFGYEPVVLTVGNNRFGFKTDYNMLEEIKGIEIIRIDDNFLLPELLSERQQQEIINLYEGIVESQEWFDEYLKIANDNKERWKLIPDEKICWVNECLKKIETKVNLNDIDIVFTTGEPFSVYILGYYIKLKYGIKWVQDYRDPWVNNQYYIDNFYRHMSSTIELQQQMERKLTKAADAIIVMAEAMRKQFSDTYGLPMEKIHTITNGYDEADFKDKNVTYELGEKFALCHNGAVYIDRNPISLIKTINNMIKKGDIDKEKIEIVFNGEVEEKWEKTIDEEDVYHIVKYNGYMEHSKSIQIAMNSYTLILFGTVGEGAQVVYTGKIFEYLKMGNPIIAFSSKGGVIDKLLDKTQTGKNFEYDDYNGIENYLKENYEAWKKGVKRFNPDSDEIKKYSREHLTKKLAEIFDWLLSCN